MEPKRVFHILLIDDHAIVRDGLRSLLETVGGMKCYEAGSGESALALLRSGLHLDVVVLDFGLPGLDGLSLIDLIHTEQGGLPVLMLSMQAEEKLALHALRQGAAGYISKSAPSQEIIRAIELVACGQKYLSAPLAARLTQAGKNSIPTVAHETLSAREFETLRLIALGKSLAEIAQILDIGEATVGTYRARLLKKLNLTTNYEIICYAKKNELVA